MFRKLFFVFTILIIYSNNTLLWSETLTMDELVERNNLYYKKFTNVLFIGEISGKKNRSFKKGKKDGKWLSYNENGQLENIINYKDREWDGLYEYYYPNVQLETKTTYKYGIEDGLWEFCNRDGSLNKIET